MKTFYTLRKFIRHVDVNCKIRKELEEKEMRRKKNLLEKKEMPEKKEKGLNEAQHRTIRRKDELREASNVHLDQQLKGKGIAANEPSVTADARRNGNGRMKDGNKGATAASLASTNRKSGQGDESSSGLGTWILYLLAFVVQAQI